MRDSYGCFVTGFDFMSISSYHTTKISRLLMFSDTWKGTGKEIEKKNITSISLAPVPLPSSLIRSVPSAETRYPYPSTASANRHSRRYSTISRLIREVSHHIETGPAFSRKKAFCIILTELQLSCKNLSASTCCK